MEESEQPRRDPDQRRLAEAMLRLSVRAEDVRDEELGARHFEV